MRRIARAWPALVVLLAMRVAAADDAPRSGAQPATPTARLLYSRGLGTEHCPDEDSVRNAVSSRLGYDPFKPDAPAVVSVDVSRAGRAVRVRIELRDDSGKVTGTRDLASAKNDCTELASAMALAISIAIDPQSIARPPEATPVAEPPLPQPPPPRSPTPPAPPCPPPPPPPRYPVTFLAGAGVLVSFGSAPAPAVGLSADAHARWRNFSVGIEGRADLEAAGEVTPRGGVATSLLLVTVVPCMHGSVLFACALGSVGALRGAGEDIDRPTTDSTFFAAAGARAGVEFPSGGRVAARIHGDLVGVLTRTSLQIDERTVWTTAPVMASFGAGAILRF